MNTDEIYTLKTGGTETSFPTTSPTEIKSPTFGDLLPKMVNRKAKRGFIARVRKLAKQTRKR